MRDFHSSDQDKLFSNLIAQFVGVVMSREVYRQLFNLVNASCSQGPTTQRGLSSSPRFGRSFLPSSIEEAHLQSYNSGNIRLYPAQFARLFEEQLRDLPNEE